MKYTHNKELNKFVKNLIKMGWQPIKKTRHWQIKSPAGKVLTVPNTPSDSRAILNFKSDLRRAG